MRAATSDLLSNWI